MRIHTIFATASTLALFATSARAANPAAAQALFDEGKGLMAARDYADACPKFEESQRQDPGLGTLFHFADCEEHLGKTATAWAAFLDVASQAKAQGESARETAARDRANALAPRLARLAIDAGASSSAPGFELTRDGSPIRAAEWSTPVPVDPGVHVIEAHAPGKGPWTTTVNLVAGARNVVTVPLLADAPQAGLVSTTTTTAGEAETSRPGKGQRAVGLVLGTAGLVGLGVGGAFGIESLIRHNEAQSHCGANGCDAAGATYRNDARTAGDASTIAFAAGGAVLLAGILTYVTAPRSAPFGATNNDARLVFTFGPGGAAVRGAW